MAKSKFIIGMRIMTILVTLAAVFVMVRSSEEVYLNNGFIFTAKYYFFSSFMYFMFANVICSVYNFLVIFLPSGSMLWRMVVVLDLVLCTLLITSLATTWECYNNLSRGNIHVPWSPICPITTRFCGAVLGAFITGAVGFGAFFILLCYTLHKIFNPLLLPELS